MRQTSFAVDISIPSGCNLIDGLQLETQDHDNKLAYTHFKGEIGMLAGELALVIASLFTGAAVYVHVAEQPARLRLDDRGLLAEWKPAYKRGFAMQASLALIGFILGVVAAYIQSEWRWLPGAFVLLANWPFTLIAIMPVNNRLMATKAEDAGTESRELIRQWGRLHAVRSLLGATSTALFLWASLSNDLSRE